MDRRSTLKIAGSIIAGSATIGNAQASKVQNASVSELENYCKELSKKHGQKVESKTIVSRDGKVADPDNVSQDINVSDIHNPQTVSRKEPDGISKELIKYEDGTEITQTTVDNQKWVIVTINGKRFKLDRQNLRNVLTNRLNKAKVRLKSIGGEKKDSVGNNKKPFNGDNQLGSANSGTQVASSITTSAFKATHEDMANFDTYWASTPVIADAKVDANHHNGTTDHIETKARATGAGYGEARVEAWDEWTHSNNHHEVSVEFNGEYAASGLNGLGASEILLRCYLEDDSGNKVRTSPALRKNQFIVDFWSTSDTYTEGLYIKDYYGDQINIGFESICIAAAAGSATTTIDAMKTPHGNHHGHFILDEYHVTFRDK
ncbi:hypothetical protein [Natrinema sp. 74]|uniref:hypothetical protein n=1 Tax=Natrinema sp. 74 TaxID=3384159 RepID=UPI0038D493BA